MTSHGRTCGDMWQSRRAGRGMVTAEFAVSSLAAVAVTIMLCWAVSLLMLQIRCHETAAEVARQYARDDTIAVAEAKSHAPTGATVTLQRSCCCVHVTVQAQGRPWGHLLPAYPLTSEFAIVMEPGS